MKWSYQAMKRLYHAMKRPYRGLKRNNHLVREVFGVLIFELSLFVCSGYGGDAIVSYGINKKEDFTFVKSSLDMFVTPAGFKPATF